MQVVFEDDSQLAARPRGKKSKSDQVQVDRCYVGIGPAALSRQAECAYAGTRVDHRRRGSELLFGQIEHVLHDCGRSEEGAEPSTISTCHQRFVKKRQNVSATLELAPYKPDQVGRRRGCVCHPSVHVWRQVGAVAPCERPGDPAKCG